MADDQDILFAFGQRRTAQNLHANGLHESFDLAGFRPAKLLIFKIVPGLPYNDAVGPENGGSTGAWVRVQSHTSLTGLYSRNSALKHRSLDAFHRRWRPSTVRDFLSW